ncbi:hypothetical protein C8Q74DRAFT_583856 [Fomes fomentarius]|nr:hypothetical protein C8Q74DRAFT_583856 [Fomes fomentarius]
MLSSSLAPPSTHLPATRQIREQSRRELGNLVDYLAAIYNPPIRGARRIDRGPLKAIASVQKDANLDAEEQLRADEYERAYTVRWLTGLLSHASVLEESFADQSDALEDLIRSVSSLIALCAGTTATRTLARRYVFPSPSLGTDVQVQLTDVPIVTADEELPTVGTQTWGSACLLAEMLIEDPARFGLSDDVLNGTRDIRVLEIGAGTGLVSLALAKLLSARMSTFPEVVGRARATIVASDYHPVVLENLRRNVDANFPDGMPHNVSLEVLALDWSTFSSTSATSSVEDIGMRPKPFDIVLGADVVYEPTHATWVRDCVSALLRRPSCAQPTAPERFHLVMPLRPTHAFESRAVEEIFPPIPAGCVPPDRHGGDGATASLNLCVLEKEPIVCEAENAGPRKEVEYMRYVIGWA